MAERLHFHFSLSCIGEGNGSSLQCSCLGNPRDGGAWWAAICGVAQSRTRLKWLSSSRLQFSSVQFSLSVVSDCLLSHVSMDCSTPGFPIHYQLRELVGSQTHVIWVSDAIQPSYPLALNLSRHQGLFWWVSSSHQVVELLEFQLQPQSFQWILGLISFRIDWLNLLAVQGTLKSLLQHHSSKASILQCSAFFIVQLSHPYMTIGKTIALARQTFVDKVMSLLFNLLSRLVITFLPRNKCLLISWLQSPSANHYRQWLQSWN